jgi:hypothetical protein
VEFNPNNNIVKLCLQGMDWKKKGKLKRLAEYFSKRDTKRRTTLKNLLLLIMWLASTKRFPQIKMVLKQLYSLH